jgi:hypothetical protein
MAPRPPITVEHKPNLQLWLQRRRQSVLYAKPNHIPIAMSSPPIFDGPAFVIVKLWMLLVPMMLVLFLCREPNFRMGRRATKRRKNYRGANCCPPSYLHK